MSTVAKPFVTPEEYLEQERKAEFKSEYHDGEIFPMVGATRRHARLTFNLNGLLYQKLGGTECQAYGSDMRVQVAATGLYTYPDISVTCGGEQFLDPETDTLLNPMLIIEVASKSTGDYDKGGKFDSYRTIPSFREYLTVAQDHLQIEHWLRQDSGQWLLTDHTTESSLIYLASLGHNLAVSEIYAGVFSDA